MALNQKFFEGHSLPLNVGTGISSGDPVAFGTLVGIAQTTADANGIATVDLHGGVYEFLVDGVDQSGNSAVAAGNTIYYVSGDTIKLSKKNTGVPFGIAVGTALTPFQAATTQLVASGNHVTKILVKIFTT